MSIPHTNGGSNTDHLAGAWSEDGRNAALLQLEKILNSHHFRTSKRCSIFLRYVVEHASTDNVERLKERTLGVEVFERAPHYDTNQDPVVRIAAGEVRKRLAQYYQEPGHEDEPRITLPAGSYVPALQVPIANHANVQEPGGPIVPLPALVEEPETEPAVPQKGAHSRSGVWAAIAIAVVTAFCGTLLVAHYRKTDLDRFWAPVYQSEGPVLVCIGQPKVYVFRRQTQAELDNWFASTADGRVPPSSIQGVPLSEFFPAWNRSISLSDATAFARISSLFGRAGKAAILRGGRSISLTELRGRPVVLIGAFNNDWTLGLSGEVRYFFDVEPDKGGLLVRDRQDPRKSDWVVRNSWPELKIPIDYAIVSRVRNPVTEQLVVTAAGITSYGTEAAGEFLSDASYFAEATRGLPGDWHKKNIQVVLSVPVMSGTAGPPKVIAVHLW